MRIGVTVLECEDGAYKRRNTMIDFDEELKKYVPSMEISEAEEAVLSREISDAADVIERILQEKKEL